MIVVDGVTVTVDGNGVEVIAAGGRRVLLPIPRPSSHSAKPTPKAAFGGHAPMQIAAPKKPKKAKPKKPKKKAPNPVPPPAKKAEPAAPATPKPAAPKAKGNGAAAASTEAST